MNTCKVCHCFNVEEHKSKVKFADDLEVLIEYSVCPMCPREFITHEQILRNEKSIKKAKAWGLRR